LLERLPQIISLLLVVLPLLVAAALLLLRRREAAGRVLSLTGQAQAGAVLRLNRLRQALERQPQNAGLQRDLGQVLLMLGQTEEAVSALLRAAELAPQDAYAYSLLGQALKRGGRWREALAAFQRCVERDPFGRRGRAARREIDSISLRMIARGGERGR